MRGRMRLALLIPLLGLLLGGCWDNREINALFILTGAALDVAEAPGEIAVTLQVANIKQDESGSGEKSGGGGGDAVILLRAVSGSLSNALSEVNRNSNHKLMFQHNQVRLFGLALAQQGITQHLDLFLRDQQARLEIPLAVVDGRAEEALTAKLSQEPISGIFLGGMFEDMSQVSPKYRIRTIDFMQMFLAQGAAPVMPILQVSGEEGRQEIKMAGLAVFKKGKMVGRLDNRETLGYLWSFGKVKDCNLAVQDPSGKAVLHMNSLDCEREVTLGQDGTVTLALTIHSLAGVAEIQGFTHMQPAELLKHLQKLGEQEIAATIQGCFATAQGLQADMLEICVALAQQYPREWEALRERWDELFPRVRLRVQVKVLIPGTGQIVQSLEMEEERK